MSKLNSDFLALRVCEFSNSLKTEWSLQLVVAPDSCVFGSDTSFGDDGSGFDYGEPGTARDDAA